MTVAISANDEANHHGIRAMVASCACFSVSDSMVKLATGSLPAGEILAIRGVLGTLILVVIVLSTSAGASLRAIHNPVVILRGFLEGAISILFVEAVSVLPIGNFTAIMMSSPLIITALSVVFLKADVGARRWMAIGLGFVGMILVAKPSASGFSNAAWLAIACSCLVAVRDLVTGKIPGHVPSQVVTLATSGITTLVGFGLMYFQPLVVPTSGSLTFLAMASVAISVANLLVIMACRKADVSVVSPFRYAIMPFALMAGYLIWGNVPDVYAALGILLIVGSGLYAFHRERVKSRQMIAG